jgi:hypothetical protein
VGAESGIGHDGRRPRARRWRHRASGIQLDEHDPIEARAVARRLGGRVVRVGDHRLCAGLDVGAEERLLALVVDLHEEVALARSAFVGPGDAGSGDQCDAGDRLQRRASPVATATTLRRRAVTHGSNRNFHHGTILSRPDWSSSDFGFLNSKLSHPRA